jgi:hypothetical protein
MIRSYLSVVALLCLAAAVGCSTSDEATGGSGGAGGGTGGSGGSGGSGGPGTQSKVITLGCTNSVTDDVSILPFELIVTADSVTASEPFTALLDGVAEFSEVFLDAAQAVVPGGVTSANLVDIAVTVHVRSGATGDDVILGAPPLDYTCALDSSKSCDPANDEASIPGDRANADCTPGLRFDPCGRFIEVPTSTDEAECTALDEGDSTTKQDQWAQNGFCVTGPLPLELEAQEASYTAGDAGSVLFGWDDVNTGATIEDDGSYALPDAVYYTDADGLNTAPVGLRVNASGVAVALQCTMAVDSGGPDGVSVCSGGDNDGDPCEAPADGDSDICFGGSNDGNSCETAADCPLGSKVCAGGANEGTACTMDTDCPESTCVDAFGECSNVDCGAGGSCEPADGASPSPDSALIAFPIEGGAGGNGGGGG